MGQSVTRKKPSGWWFVIGALAIVGGCGGSCAGMFVSIINDVKDMKRVVVPGQTTVELTAGDHTIFAESKSKVGGEAYRFSGSFSIRCGMQSPSGKSIQIDNTSSNTNYSFGSYSGESLFTFSAPEDGTYTIECLLDDRDDKLVLAIGQMSIIKKIIIGVLGGLAGLGLGITIIVLTAVKRSRWRRQSRQPAAARVASDE